MHLNRPAVLTLYSDQGEEFYATIISFRGHLATFTLGSETKKVSVEEILPRWYGDYTLLWSMPPQYGGALQPGDQGPVVEWLDNKLASIQSRPAQPGENVTFNDQMISEIKRFQFTKNLVPDGIVGPQTIIHLNTEASSEVPKLIETHEGN